MQTKVIGRQPTDHGPYDPQLAYGKKFTVTLFDCGWESKHDNNTTAPATLNELAGTITPNIEHWIHRWGSYNQWLIDNGYKKVPASNIEDLVLEKPQNEINAALVGEIGADSAPGTVKGRIKSLEDSVGSGGSVDQRIDQAKSDVIGGASSSGNTLKKVEDRVSPLEEAVGSGGSIDSRISSAVEAEKSRAETAEANRYTKSETYTKAEVNDLVDTPHQEYVTVDAYANLPATGSKDTIYRVSNYNGSTSQVATDVYSEYAWDGTKYVFLCVKSQIGEVFDISVYNNNAKYADLAAALNGGANIPQPLQKGGMSVKFVQSSDNTYVQYILMASSFSANVFNWQKGGIGEVSTKMDVVTDTAIYKGRFFAASGTNVVETADATRYLTDFVPVSGLASVSVYHQMNITSSPYPQIALYDSNKDFIKRAGLSGNNTAITLSDVTGVAYIRASMSLTNIGNTSIKRPDGGIIFDGSFYAKTMREHIVALEDKDTKPTKNSKKTVESGGVYNSIASVADKAGLYQEDILMYKKIDANGAIHDASDCFITPKIPVTEGDSIDWYYYLTGATETTSFRLACYSEDGSYINSWGSAGADTAHRGGDIIMPENAAYIRASMVLSKLVSGPTKIVLLGDTNTVLWTGKYYEKNTREYIEGFLEGSEEPADIVREKLQLTFGNSVNANSTQVFGYDLYNNCKSLEITNIPSAYQYWIKGYNDPEVRNSETLVYDSGWQLGKKKFVFENTSLYYVLNIQRRNGADITNDDIAAVTAYVTRLMDDAYVNQVHGEVYQDEFEKDIAKLPEYYFEFYPATYTLLKKDFGTSPSSDEMDIYNAATQLAKAFTQCDGTFTADNITFDYDGSDKATIDAAIESLTLNNSLAYAKLVDGHYIVWVIEKISNKDKYIHKKVNEINNLLRDCATKGDAFVFVTDQHWYKGARRWWNARRSPNLMRYIFDNTSVDKIIDGGDREDGFDNAFARKCFEALRNENYYPTVGNHELLKYCDENDAYACGYQHLDNDGKIIWGPEGQLSYYFDNKIKKIRYISLQSVVVLENPTQQTGTAKLGYPDETIAWFRDTALDVETGWTIVIFSHYLAFTEFVQTDEQGRRIAVEHNVTPPPNGSFWDSYRAIYNIIREYDGNGTIACFVQGHTHWDGVLYVDGVKNTFPVIVTMCDRLNVIDNGLQSDRVAGTITENAFDVMVLDTTKRTVSCVRIGAPAWVNYPPVYNPQEPDATAPWGKAETRLFTY